VEQASQRPGEPARTTTWDYQPGTFTPLAQTERTWPRDTSQDEVDQRFYAIITDLIGAPSELIGPERDLAGRQQHTLWRATTWVTGGVSSPLRPGLTAARSATDLQVKPCNAMARRHELQTRS
jgi:hypothetical protein